MSPSFCYCSLFSITSSFILPSKLTLSYTSKSRAATQSNLKIWKEKHIFEEQVKKKWPHAAARGMVSEKNVLTKLWNRLHVVASSVVKQWTSVYLDSLRRGATKLILYEKIRFTNVPLFFSLRKPAFLFFHPTLCSVLIK